MATKAKAKAKAEKVVSIPAIDIERVELTVVGDTPLLTHKWSEKAKLVMAAAQAGEKKTKKREPKDPRGEFLDSLYWLTPRPEGEVTDEEMEEAVFGIKAISFKMAAVGATRWVDGLAMTEVRGMFHVEGDLLPILTPEPPTMRMDPVSVGMTKDLRYRPEFWPWEVNVPIRYNAGAVKLEQIVTLLNLAGFSLGVGDFRPERNGQHGLFHIKAEGE